MSEETYVYVIHIRTTPERLWEALTADRFTKQYWGGPPIESDWKTGSSIRHGSPAKPSECEWEGTILECDPPRTLSYTFFNPKDPEEVAAPSRITMTIKPAEPGSVALKLVHDRLTKRKLEDVTGGWPDILSDLKTLIETGKPLSARAGD